jgi:3D (Asp-Asp-Asp) domain-containing protein
MRSTMRVAVALSWFILACGGSSNDGAAADAPAGVTVKLASLSGPEETPPTSSAAIGRGVLAVNEGTGAARGFVVTSGIVSTNAHIHLAPRGTPGAVSVPLTKQGEIWVVPDGTVLNADQLAAFRAGNLYYNVHTAANTGGEIRGQLDDTATGTAKFASLSGPEETPPTNSTATGRGVLVVDEATGAARGFVGSTGLVSTNAHIHLAPRGTPGPITVPLSKQGELWLVRDGTVLNAEQLAAFRAGTLYYNVHTAANTGGEIRGQIE